MEITTTALFTTYSFVLPRACVTDGDQIAAEENLMNLHGIGGEIAEVNWSGDGLSVEFKVER